MNPDQEKKVPYISEITKGEDGLFVAASDYVQILKDAVSKWLPAPLVSLGTFGFGRSDGRDELRDFFEVDAKHIVYATLYSLNQQDKFDSKKLKKAAENLGIDFEKANPARS